MPFISYPSHANAIASNIPTIEPDDNLTPKRPTILDETDNWKDNEHEKTKKKLLENRKQINDNYNNFTEQDIRIKNRLTDHDDSLRATREAIDGNIAPIVDKNKKDIETNKNGIATNAEGISKNAKGISENARGKEILAKGLNDHQTSLDQHGLQLGQHEEKIKAIEEKIKGGKITPTVIENGDRAHVKIGAYDIEISSREYNDLKIKISSTNQKLIDVLNEVKLNGTTRTLTINGITIDISSTTTLHELKQMSWAMVFPSYLQQHPSFVLNGVPVQQVGLVANTTGAAVVPSTVAGTSAANQANPVSSGNPRSSTTTPNADNKSPGNDKPSGGKPTEGVPSSKPSGNPEGSSPSGNPTNGPIKRGGANPSHNLADTANTETFYTIYTSGAAAAVGLGVLTFLRLRRRKGKDSV